MEIDKQSKLPFRTLWSSGLHAHSDWSFMLPRGLVEAQREERALGLQNAYCPFTFAECRQNTKYATGWMGSCSNPPQPPSICSKRERQTWCYPPPLTKENKRGKKALSSPQSRKEEPKFNFLSLEKKTLCRSPLIWVMPGELFSACVYLPIPLIPFVIVVQVRYWNAQCRV